MSGFRNRSVNVHQFSMIPRADIPRSSFRMEKAYKTTLDADYLYPILCEEVLPGDSFRGKFTTYVRTETLLFPILDNLHLETFFFFVPNRLVWSNWQKFMGEREDPDDPIDYIIPTVNSPTNGWPVGSIADYFGIPTAGQVTAGAVLSHNTLPFRAYNLIYNEWFRDQNMIGSLVVNKTDGPDNNANYALRRRGKRHDYFTSALPWTQKGDPVSIGLVGSATITPSGNGVPTWTTGGTTRILEAGSQGDAVWSGSDFEFREQAGWVDPKLQVNLSESVATTINEIRQAFQIQKLLERDARGGTRYTEIVRSHFGVLSPDARLQRPEYIGGGYQPINIHPVAQTVDNTDGPLGQLGAFGTSSGQHRFSLNATEHGYIIGLVNIRADLTYQQGLRRHWSKSTRYDYYFPVFAALGEQAILNREIFCKANAADDDVFGYQERWAEYRFLPSEITGDFRSTATLTLDAWHLAQKFDNLPTLNSTFIESRTPMERVLATGDTAPHFILDGLFSIKAARPLPMYSVPGLVDHF